MRKIFSIAALVAMAGPAHPAPPMPERFALLSSDDVRLACAEMGQVAIESILRRKDEQFAALRSAVTMRNYWLVGLQPPTSVSRMDAMRDTLLKQGKDALLEQVQYCDATALEGLGAWPENERKGFMTEARADALRLTEIAAGKGAGAITRARP